MIPVAFESYRYREDAAALFAAVRDLPAAIWLDGGAPGGASGRWDIITAAPLVLLQTQGELTTVAGLGENTRSTDPPLTLAQQVLDAMGGLEETPTTLPFVGGLAGFCGYDLGRCWNRPASTGTALAAPALTDVAGFPDMRLGWYAWALALDHQRGVAMLVFHPSCPTKLRRDIKRRLAGPEPCRDEPFTLRGHFTPTIDRDAYLHQITRIQDYIRAGDCYQVNFAQHFSACFDGDPWQAYRQLRRALPSPHSAFMAWEQQAVLSFSPESLLHVRGGRVETRPIKGTRPRGTTPVEDNALADALRDSAKDRAENLMIVDLLRNDLGKTCVPGSVAVPELYRLASFANVHHLVSTVTGTMAPGVSALDVLAGCFPGGSITGAPKRRAMEIIDELEAVRRAVYCGSIGYISANGRMDMNIAIRTLAAAGDRLHCWGGGGIVADSVPAEEYRETLAKVSILMDSLATSKPRASGGANL